MRARVGRSSRSRRNPARESRSCSLESARTRTERARLEGRNPRLHFSRRGSSWREREEEEGHVGASLAPLAEEKRARVAPSSRPRDAKPISRAPRAGNRRRASRARDLDGNGEGGAFLPREPRRACFRRDDRRRILASARERCPTLDPTRRRGGERKTEPKPSFCFFVFVLGRSGGRSIDGAPRRVGP